MRSNKIILLFLLYLSKISMLKARLHIFIKDHIRNHLDELQHLGTAIITVDLV